MNKKKHGFLKMILMYCRKFNKHDTFGLTAEVSFYLLTAMFPFFILLFILASQISDTMQSFLMNIITFLPKDLENMVTEVLVSFTQSLPIIITATVFGLWYMSSVILTISKALNRFYGIRETRGYLKLKGLSLLFSLFIILLIIISFALIIFGEGTQFLLEKNNILSFLIQESVWNYARYIGVFLVILITILAMFKILPNKFLSVKAVLAGATLTTIAWCITSYGFSFYVNYFSTYHILYGSLASVIVLITWVYLSAFVILLGGSLNAFWYRLRMAKKLTKARKHSFEEDM